MIFSVKNDKNMIDKKIICPYSRDQVIYTGQKMRDKMKDRMKKITEAVKKKWDWVIGVFFAVILFSIFGFIYVHDKYLIKIFKRKNKD